MAAFMVPAAEKAVDPHLFLHYSTNHLRKGWSAARAAAMALSVVWCSVDGPRISIRRAHLRTTKLAQSELFVLELIFMLMPVHEKLSTQDRCGLTDS
jgi:hypothetical protein